MSTSLTIKATKNYRLFSQGNHNRPFDLKKHKALMESMKVYGFLREFPIICFRNESKALVVKDGQHRLAIAESLGLTVYWVEASVDFDVAVVNSTAKSWMLRDYVDNYAKRGFKAYAELGEFADAHGLPIGTAACLLSGTTTFANVKREFFAGTYKIKDRDWADRVAASYAPLVLMSRAIRNARFVEACMAACRVADFDPQRLVQCANRCREKLVAYSTRDAYLDMIQDIYNFGRHKIIDVKVAAMAAMRKRNACQSKNGNGAVTTSKATKQA